MARNDWLQFEIYNARAKTDEDLQKDPLKLHQPFKVDQLDDHHDFYIHLIPHRLNLELWNYRFLSIRCPKAQQEHASELSSELLQKLPLCCRNFYRINREICFTQPTCNRAEHISRFVLYLCRQYANLLTTLRSALLPSLRSNNRLLFLMHEMHLSFMQG